MVLNAFIILGLVPFLGSEPRTTTSVVLANDLSSSVSAPICESVASRLRQLLAVRGTKRLDVLVLGTGDVSTGLEPFVLVPWSRYEPSGTLFEEPAAMEHARDAWVAALRGRCETGVRTPNVSPIFAAIRRGVESLHAHCAELEAGRERCARKLLFVNSDMKENGERSILAHLLAASRGETVRTALPQLALGDIQIASICGVSATRVSPGEPYISPDALVMVWRQVLGPSMPSFDAACPTGGTP